MSSFDHTFQNNTVKVNGNRCYSQNDVKKMNCNSTIFFAEDCKNNIIELNSFSGKGALELKFNSVVNCSFSFGRENRINSKMSCTFYNVYGKLNDGSMIQIGDRNIFNGGISLLAPLEEGNSIIIGNDNLFAGGISFRGCNEHTVWDMDTGVKLDSEKGIVVGNHNWFCEQALVLNNTVILDDCVIAARALVNKPFNEYHVLLAGCPATVKRRRIAWDRKYMVGPNIF